MAVTFRNYHNFSAADRATVNQSVFDALKPGGYYGIVDHTRRHNEPENRENGRRVDPVVVIKEVQEAGFELVDFSNLYYRPNDVLTLEVANQAVNDRTNKSVVSTGPATGDAVERAKRLQARVGH